jgi:hypothetical protein
MSANPLIPDLAEAARFLAALDAESNASFGFRTFDDRGGDIRLAIKCYGTLLNGIRQSSSDTKNGKACVPAQLLAYMQSLGAGAFVVPNELDGEGQLRKNVIRVRLFYVDADAAEQVARVHAFIAVTGLEPTVMVASGGIHSGVDKLQVFWRIDGCLIAKFTSGQLTLVSRVGTDSTVQDAGRVMRIPGFWHQKDAPRQTRIITLTDRAYDCRDFLRRVERQPQICNPWSARNGGKVGTHARGTPRQANTGSLTARLRVLLDRHGGLVTPAVHALLREAQAPTEGAGGNRHATLVAVVARLVQIGWPDLDIRQLVLPVVLNIWDVDPREVSGRLDGILAWTREQEAAALAAEPTLIWPSRSPAASGGAREATR